MSSKDYFDLACQQARWNKGVDCGYICKSGRKYDAYLSNTEFDKFVSEMEQKYNHVYQEYCKGQGGELKEKQYPPKMAALASSSRMIYLTSRDITGFEFEKKLPAGGAYGTPNLDGYLSTPTHEIFVEAKCHEMFDTPDKDIADCYLELYKKIGTDGPFAYKDESFWWNGNKLHRLDLKQLICHYLGIINTFKTNPSLQNKKIRFIYYTHALSSNEKQYLFDISPRVLRNVEKFLTQESQEIAMVDHRWLFAKIAEILNAPSAISDNFELVHCETPDEFVSQLK